MAFLSTFLNLILLLLLLCTELQLISLAQNAEESEPETSVRIFDSDVGRLSSNVENNPFLGNQTSFVFVPKYNRNPFLTGNIGKNGNNPDRTDTSDTAHVGNPFFNFDNTNIYFEPARPTPQVVPLPQPAPVPFPQPLSGPEFIDSAPNIVNWPDRSVTSPPPISSGPTKVSGSRKISDIKCEEYSANTLNTANVGTFPGTGSGPIKVSTAQCTPPNPLVTAGSPASLGEFPHMTALGRQTGATFELYCGGSLISESWVLTAAHCAIGPSGRPNAVKLGFINKRTDQNVLTINIKRFEKHPSYSAPAKYADIALVELERTVTFTSTIRPACLYQQYDTVPQKAWACGWGVTELGGEDSDTLQKVFLDIIDNIQCSLRHNNSLAVPYGISPSMICAGDPRGGWAQDTCQGDSGGPLQITLRRNPCLFVVVGITSFGNGCAIVNSPGVYTRVAHYLTWIENKVWPGWQ